MQMWYNKQSDHWNTSFFFFSYRFNIEMLHAKLLFRYVKFRFTLLLASHKGALVSLYGIWYINTLCSIKSLFQSLLILLNFMWNRNRYHFSKITNTIHIVMMCYHIDWALFMIILLQMIIIHMHPSLISMSKTKWVHTSFHKKINITQSIYYFIFI